LENTKHFSFIKKHIQFAKGKRRYFNYRKMLLQKNNPSSAVEAKKSKIIYK